MIFHICAPFFQRGFDSMEFTGNNLNRMSFKLNIGWAGILEIQ